MRTHGESGWKDRKPTPEFTAWKNLCKRCDNPNDVRYADYGGRGIAICERWQKYGNFLADMGRRPSTSHSIDRIDNDLGYEPSNCKWSTADEQKRNMRSNRWLTACGETLCLTDWSKRTNLAIKSLKYRLNQGWSPDRTVSEPRSSRGGRRHQA